MRKQRIAMVQTLEQYMLCYKAVATLFEQQLKMIDSHTYENIDGDGEPIMRRQLIRSDIISKDQNQDIVKQKIQTNQQKVISETNMPSIQNSPSNDEVRHERIVGKATVIRRPSIAKLKAIFENQNSGPNEPTVGRPSSSSLNRNQGMKDNSRNCKTFNDNNISNDYHNRQELENNLSQMMSNNFEQNMRQEVIQNHDINSNDIERQPIYVEYNPSINQINHSFESRQTFESNSMELLHQNHQKLQQEIRQHIQRKHLQSVQAIHPQMNSNSFAISPQMQNQTLVVHQMSAQMASQLALPVINQIQSQPLPPPPKPPRTYQHQYQHMSDGAITSVPNTSEGRLIVSVALPRRPTNDLSVNHTTHYEAIGQRPSNLSVPNLDSLFVNTNNNIEDYNNSNINPNNSIKVMNVSNNNIYESVVPKYRSGQTLEPTLPNGQQNQGIHSYYELMRLKNPNFNSTLPFYDTLYTRNGFMTVPNLRHIPVPTIAQIQYPFAQFKPNFEAIYSNTNTINNNNNNNNIANNLSKTKSEQNIQKTNEKIANNLVNNFNNKSENIKNTKQINKKVKNVEKKDEKTQNSCKTSAKPETTSKTTANTATNSETAPQDSNSGAFSKISNAFKGLRMKSSVKTKNKSNANTTNNTTNSVNNGMTS